MGSDDAEMLLFLTAGFQGSNTASHVMFPRTGHARFPLINKTVKDMTSIPSDKTCVKPPVGQTRHKPEKKALRFQNKSTSGFTLEALREKYMYKI